MLGPVLRKLFSLRFHPKYSQIWLGGQIVRRNESISKKSGFNFYKPLTNLSWKDFLTENSNGAEEIYTETERIRDAKVLVNNRYQLISKVVPSSFAQS